jgi:uncharacterized SAM-binding protein YcdF (DUF218 family)
MTIRGRRVRLALAAAALLALFWGAGFAWFLRMAGEQSPLPTRADGIVALTGGAGRVEMALRLLAEGRARVALISGVGGAAEFAALARRAGVDPALGARVTLGRAAQSTRGNAAETAAWAGANDIRTLIVVTAFYHMPRALAELSRALPAVRLYPAPVMPGTSWRLLAGEYTKWLAAELGLSALGPRQPLRTEGGG